jgi:hypothetical protein
MGQSQGLLRRIAGAAAEQGAENPFMWANNYIWKLASHSDWVSAWDYAEASKTVNQNPDTGARDDVITDGMLLSAVQALVATNPM